LFFCLFCLGRVPRRVGRSSRPRRSSDLVGSHLGDLIPHEQTATLGFSQGIADYFRHCDTRKERPLHAARGDLLAHHALTVHRAEANASETRQRRAIGFIYYSAEAEQDSFAHAAYQERLKQRMAATDRI